MISETQFDGLLAAYPALFELPTHLRQELLAEATPLATAAGQVLFDIDSPCTLFLMTTTGSLRVLKAGMTGREVLLYRVQPGELCLLTLSCLLHNKRYAAKAVVETNVTAIGLSRALFLRLLDQMPTFRLFVLRFLTERMLAFIDLVEEISFGSLQQRLAALLLSRGTTIHTTHQNLADDLGSTREAVSRTLESLEEQGVVKLARGRIIITDRAGLETAAIIR